MGGCGAELQESCRSDRDYLCNEQSLGASFGLLQGNLARLPPRLGPLCAVLSTASRFISRLAAGRLTRAGGALLGVMFVMFPGSPSRKNILETQRFPFCWHTNEPQTEPTSKRPANEPVSPRSPPWFQEGPNNVVV